MKTYEAANYITTSAFITTLLTNSLLIFLTIFHIKLICGTYKWMIVIFAFIGILFSFTEAIVRPCVHNFNGGLIFFSLNLYLPKWLLSIGVACYAGFFSSLLSFVTMQFIFRCWTLIGSKLVKWFRGWKIIFWVFFVTFPCSLFAALVVFLLQPDEYADGYMEAEVLKIYELRVAELPRFIVIPLGSSYGDLDFEIRWKNLICVLIICTALTFNLMIIIFCALRMRSEMHIRLRAMSKKNRRLETQFFKALVAQSAFPTLLLVLPTGPVLLLPFFNLKISLQSGFLISIFSLYPPLDSIAMMVIITEYKTRVKRVLTQVKRLCGVQVPDNNLDSGFSDSDVGNGGSFQLSTIEMDRRVSTC